jgi:hypothetical protein
MAELEKVGKSIEEAKKHPEIATIVTTSVAGAVIGSVLPVVGTTIGLGIGAVIGGVGVIANELKKNK